MQESAGLSDDDISITSTAPSEPQEEYDLECILGQKKVDGEDMYLVKWTGYPLERCTWEPESVFCNPQTLQDWARKQKAVARGEEKAFDVDALERKIKAFEEATIKRRERRRKKRERLGYPTKPASDEDDSTSDLGDFVVPDDEVEYIHSDSDEGPLIRRRGETSKTASRDKTSVSSSSTYPQASTKASSKSTSKRPEQQSTLGSSTNKTKPRVPLPHGNRDRPVQPKLGVDTTATAPKPRPAPDPIPILFGGQKARKSLPGPSSKKNGELFNKLSTQRRWEKALRRERAPDISQLELRRPQDWIHPQKDPSPPPPSSEMRDSRYAYDLFVRNEQSPPSVSRQLTSRERVRDLPERRPSWDQPSLEASPSRNASISSYSPLEKERPQYYVSGRTTTRSGRFWNPGEVLLSVNFGAVGKLIGDVRICGLNDATRKQVLKLKRGPNLELNFKDVCTIEEYTLLCERRVNISYAITYVIGFDDNAHEVTSMADYLRRHDLAALWYHPAEDVQTVFVAYASSSTSWGFLDNNRSFPPNASLRIVARSYLPPVSTVHQNMPAPAAEPVELPVTSAINPAVVSAEEAKGDGSTREEYEDPPYIPLFPPTPLPTNVEDKDLVNVFRERWDITFEELSRVNNPQDDNVARTFFLYFPSEVEDEFQLVLRFLKKHPGTIFTNRVEGDWGRFVESPKNGTVISHQSYDLFDQMPNFQKVIRKPSNIFLVDLVRAIDFLDYKIHLQRLFPHGCVILMTEDFMLREPEAAVRVMRWFLDYLPVKFPGTWKIFFRPNIVGWLIDAFDTWPDDTLYHILCIIRHMMPDFPENHYNAYLDGMEEPYDLDGETDDEGQQHPFISPSFIPDYGCRSEDEHPDIPKGLTQEERDTDHLVEYFAGWIACHWEKYRRFVVLSHHKHQPRWKDWNHLELMHSDEFFRTFVQNDTRSSRNRQPSSSR